MDKTWYMLVLIGFLEVLVFTAYQFYISLTGQNVDLVKRVDETPIEADLHIEKLSELDATQQNIVVSDESLN